jgi:DeoR/GlpR family transcriptional regulator of sugar metabolism
MMARTSNNISQIQRLDVIRQQLATNGEVFIAELAKRCGVSEMTVRRDIDMLEAQGEVIRTHGGAASAKRLTFEFTFRTNQQKNLNAKRAIAIAALKHISDGQVVLLDTGTTTLELARLIAVQRKVTIITTSLAIVSELQFVNDIETILLGGFLRKGSPDIHGPLTEENIERFRTDIAFIGADGIDLNGNTFTDDLRIATLSRCMAKNADKVVIVSDSSKIGRKSMCKMLSADEYNLIITDSNTGDKLLKQLKIDKKKLEIVD